MSVLHEVRPVIDRLAALRVGEAVSGDVRNLGDEALVEWARAAGDARKVLDLVIASLASEIDRRSTRDRGYSGLAQATGFRNATSLIQNITGQSAAEVRKATAVGNDLAAVVPAPMLERADGDSSPSAPPGVVPWFVPLTTALRVGRVSREQYDAIRRGLGEPPVDRYPAESTDDIITAWQAAGEMLIEEAASQTVEDLRASARLARDTLDPVGCGVRFEERFARRSFTMWVDEDGQTCARIRFDDDAAAWARTILNAALRPRRGPRFTGPTAPADADAPVEADTRSNEQLQYDTILAILRTGAQADPTTAFGDRQPGVRILTTPTDTGDTTGGGDGDARPVGIYEETGQAVPATIVDTYLCNAGHRTITLDPDGTPLNVGRERRLFTPAQRIALALRDGGCLTCGAEPSRCEAHHINEWATHHGRTDLADGILLCRTCHMRLHTHHDRIRRQHDGTYWLDPSPTRAATGSVSKRLRPRAPTRFLTLRT